MPNDPIRETTEYRFDRVRGRTVMASGVIVRAASEDAARARAHAICVRDGIHRDGDLYILDMEHANAR